MNQAQASLRIKYVYFIMHSKIYWFSEENFTYYVSSVKNTLEGHVSLTLLVMFIAALALISLLTISIFPFLAAFMRAVPPRFMESEMKILLKTSTYNMGSKD